MDRKIFVATLVHEFEVCPDIIKSCSDDDMFALSLVEDLGLDSFDLFDLIALIEEIAGTETDINDHAFPMLQSLGDAFAFLQELENVEAHHDPLERSGA